jgi:3-hydroxyacyl-[acyl-carrier-protein] dehydratase
MADLLIDFERLDLSRTIADKAAILAKLQQRGRFEQLDGVLHCDQAAQLVVGYKDVLPGDWWVPDHIPGRPFFPGALMIEGSAQLCSYDFMVRNPGFHGFLGFAGVDAVRFRRAVAPTCRLIYAARPIRMRSNLFLYAAQGFVERELVYEGQIMGITL